MKERARAARKAAYQKQKAKIKERVAILRASPEYKRKKEELRLARKDTRNAQKLRSKEIEQIKKANADKLADENYLAKRSNRDAEIVSTIKTAGSLHEKLGLIVGSADDTSEGSANSASKKPLLRLIRNPEFG